MFPQGRWLHTAQRAYVRRSSGQQRLTVATKLEKVLKRELEIDGKLYTITISPEGVKVVAKGKRNGQELSWRSIISGDAKLTEDLINSLGATGGPR